MRQLGSRIVWPFAGTGLIAAIAILAACAIAAPPSAPVPSPPAEPVASTPDRQPIFVVHQPLSAQVWRDAGALGAQRGIIIYAYNMDQKQTGTVDLVMLRRFIEKTVDPRFDGFATIDLEHPYYKWLEQGPESPQFQQAQSQMLAALRVAKTLRPNAKWGFYGLPRMRYGRYNDERKTLAAAPRVLFDESDWISPAVYDRWPSIGDAKRTEKDRKFVTERVKLARQVAGDKLVLTMIHHRFHHKGNIDQPPAFSLISAEELRQTAQWAMDAGSDGIVWWGADDYSVKLVRDKATLEPDHRQYERQQRMKVVFAEENTANLPLQQHLDQVYMRVMEVFSEVVRGTDAPATQPADENGKAPES